MEYPPASDADLSAFCCPTPSCDHYGKRGAGNLTVCDRIGRDRQYRLLRCRTCPFDVARGEARFGERRGTVFFGSHLPRAKAVSILAHVQEGVGMRQAGRPVGSKEDTVIRYARLAGAHAAGLHDELVAFPPATREVQFDGKWSFAQKKEATRDPDDPDDPADDGGGGRGDR